MTDTYLRWYMGAEDNYTCPVCGNELFAAGARYCHICGSKLPSGLYVEYRRVLQINTSDRQDVTSRRTDK